MPKFKYTPKKDNLLNETIKPTEDENTKIEFDTKAFEIFATNNQTPCDTPVN